MPQPTAAEQLAELYNVHSIDLLRFESDERKRVLSLLKQLEDDLVLQLKDLNPNDVERIAYQQQRTAQLLAQTKQTINSAYGNIDSVHTKDMQSLAEVESLFARGSINNVVGFGAASELMTVEQLRAVASDVLIEGAPSRDWWRGQRDKTRRDFEQQIRMGVLSGDSIDDMVRRVRGKSTGKTGSFEDPTTGKKWTGHIFKGGIMDVSTRNAEALVRTSVAAVASEARMQTFIENQDVVKGVQQISMLDGRTTDICRAYSNKVFLFEGVDLKKKGRSYKQNIGAMAKKLGRVKQPFRPSVGELLVGSADDVLIVAATNAKNFKTVWQELGSDGWNQIAQSLKQFSSKGKDWKNTVGALGVSRWGTAAMMDPPGDGHLVPSFAERPTITLGDSLDWLDDTYMSYPITIAPDAADLVAAGAESVGYARRITAGMVGIPLRTPVIGASATHVQAAIRTVNPLTVTAGELGALLAQIYSAYQWMLKTSPEKMSEYSSEAWATMAIQAQGYDAVILQNSDETTESIIIFDADQVRVVDDPQAESVVTRTVDPLVAFNPFDQLEEAKQAILASRRNEYCKIIPEKSLFDMEYRGDPPNWEVVGGFVQSIVELGERFVLPAFRLGLGDVSAWASYDPRFRQILVDANFYGRPTEEILASYRQASMSGFHNPYAFLAPGYSTGAHEFGHAIYDQLPDGMRQKFTSWLKAMTITRADVSEYAMSDEDELFAETFSAIVLLPESMWTPWMILFRDTFNGMAATYNEEAADYLAPIDSLTGQLVARGILDPKQFSLLPSAASEIGLPEDGFFPSDLAASNHVEMVARQAGLLEEDAKEDVLVIGDAITRIARHSLLEEESFRESESMFIIEALDKWAPKFQLETDLVVTMNVNTEELRGLLGEDISSTYLGEDLQDLLQKGDIEFDLPEAWVGHVAGGVTSTSSQGWLRRTYDSGRPIQITVTVPAGSHYIPMAQELHKVGPAPLAGSPFGLFFGGGKARIEEVGDVVGMKFAVSTVIRTYPLQTPVAALAPYKLSSPKIVEQFSTLQHLKEVLHLFVPNQLRSLALAGTFGDMIAKNALQYTESDLVKVVRKELDLALEQGRGEESILFPNPDLPQHVYSDLQMNVFFKEALEKLTPEQSEAIALYTSSMHTPINDLLRFGEVRGSTLRGQVEGWIESIDAAMAPSQVLFQVDRGVMYTTLQRWLDLPKPVGVNYGSEEFDFDTVQHIRDFLIGQRLPDPGFASTSTRPGAAAGHAPVTVRIVVPAGTRALPITSVSRFREGEGEVLLDRGLTYEIVDARYTRPYEGANERIVIDVKVISEADQQPKLMTEKSYVTGQKPTALALSIFWKEPGDLGRDVVFYGLTYDECFDKMIEFDPVLFNHLKRPSVRNSIFSSQDRSWSLPPSLQKKYPLLGEKLSIQAMVSVEDFAEPVSLGMYLATNGVPAPLAKPGLSVDEVSKMVGAVKEVEPPEAFTIRWRDPNVEGTKIRTITSEKSMDDALEKWGSYIGQSILGTRPMSPEYRATVFAEGKVETTTGPLSLTFGVQLREKKAPVVLSIYLRDAGIDPKKISLSEITPEGLTLKGGRIEMPRPIEYTLTIDGIPHRGKSKAEVAKRVLLQSIEAGDLTDWIAPSQIKAFKAALEADDPWVLGQAIHLFQPAWIHKIFLEEGGTDSIELPGAVIPGGGPSFSIVDQFGRTWYDDQDIFTVRSGLSRTQIDEYVVPDDEIDPESLVRVEEGVGEITWDSWKDQAYADSLNVKQIQSILDSSLTVIDGQFRDEHKEALTQYIKGNFNWDHLIESNQFNQYAVKVITVEEAGLWVQDALHKGVSALTPQTIFRGTHLRHILHDMLPEGQTTTEGLGRMVGMNIDIRRFLATSVSPSVAVRFFTHDDPSLRSLGGVPVLCRITAPPETEGLYLSDTGLAGDQHAEEKEYLLNRGQGFKINGFFHVTQFPPEMLKTFHHLLFDLGAGREAILVADLEVIPRSAALDLGLSVEKEIPRPALGEGKPVRQLAEDNYALFQEYYPRCGIIVSLPFTDPNNPPSFITRTTLAVPFVSSQSDVGQRQALFEALRTLDPSRSEEDIRLIVDAGLGAYRSLRTPADPERRFKEFFDDHGFDMTDVVNGTMALRLGGRKLVPEQNIAWALAKDPYNRFFFGVGDTNAEAVTSLSKQIIHAVGVYGSSDAYDIGEFAIYFNGALIQRIPSVAYYDAQSVYMEIFDSEEFRADGGNLRMTFETVSSHAETKAPVPIEFEIASSKSPKEQTWLMSKADVRIALSMKLGIETGVIPEATEFGMGLFLMTDGQMVEGHSLKKVKPQAILEVPPELKKPKKMTIAQAIQRVSVEGDFIIYEVDDDGIVNAVKSFRGLDVNWEAAHEHFETLESKNLSPGLELCFDHKLLDEVVVLDTKKTTTSKTREDVLAAIADDLEAYGDFAPVGKPKKTISKFPGPLAHIPDELEVRATLREIDEGIDTSAPVYATMHPSTFFSRFSAYKTEESGDTLGGLKVHDVVEGSILEVKYLLGHLAHVDPRYVFERVKSVSAPANTTLFLEFVDVPNLTPLAKVSHTPEQILFPPGTTFEIVGIRTIPIPGNYDQTHVIMKWVEPNQNVVEFKPPSKMQGPPKTGKFDLPKTVLKGWDDHEALDIYLRSELFTEEKVDSLPKAKEQILIYSEMSDIYDFSPKVIATALTPIPRPLPVTRGMPMSKFLEAFEIDPETVNTRAKFFDAKKIQELVVSFLGQRFSENRLVSYSLSTTTSAIFTEDVSDYRAPREVGVILRTTLPTGTKIVYTDAFRGTIKQMENRTDWGPEYEILVNPGQLFEVTEIFEGDRFVDPTLIIDIKAITNTEVQQTLKLEGGPRKPLELENKLPDKKVIAAIKVAGQVFTSDYGHMAACLDALKDPQIIVFLESKGYAVDMISEFEALDVISEVGGDVHLFEINGKLYTRQEAMKMLIPKQSRPKERDWMVIEDWEEVNNAARSQVYDSLRARGGDEAGWLVVSRFGAGKGFYIPEPNIEKAAKEYAKLSGLDPDDAVFESLFLIDGLWFDGDGLWVSPDVFGQPEPQPVIKGAAVSWTDSVTLRRVSASGITHGEALNNLIDLYPVGSEQRLLLETDLQRLIDDHILFMNLFELSDGSLVTANQLTTRALVPTPEAPPLKIVNKVVMIEGKIYRDSQLHSEAFGDMLVDYPELKQYFDEVQGYWVAKDEEGYRDDNMPDELRALGFRTGLFEMSDGSIVTESGLQVPTPMPTDQLDLRVEAVVKFKDKYYIATLHEQALSKIVADFPDIDEAKMYDDESFDARLALGSDGKIRVLGSEFADVKADDLNRVVADIRDIPGGNLVVSDQARATVEQLRGVETTFEIPEVTYSIEPIWEGEDDFRVVARAPIKVDMEALRREPYGTSVEPIFEKDDTIVGILNISIYDEAELEHVKFPTEGKFLPIEIAFIAPEARGQGVAQELFLRAVDQAKKLGWDGIISEEYRSGDRTQAAFEAILRVPGVQAFGDVLVMTEGLSELASSEIPEVISQISGMYNLTPTRVVVESVDDPKAEMKRCFNNAYNYIKKAKKGEYVLGYMLFHGVPIEHAWVKIEGKYLDPTPLVGDGPTEYFSLVELSMEELKAAKWKNDDQVDLNKWYRNVGSKSLETEALPEIVAPAVRWLNPVTGETIVVSGPTHNAAMDELMSRYAEGTEEARLLEMIDEGFGQNQIFESGLFLLDNGEVVDRVAISALDARREALTIERPVRLSRVSAVVRHKETGKIFKGVTHEDAIEQAYIFYNKIIPDFEEMIDSGEADLLFDLNLVELSDGRIIPSRGFEIDIPYFVSGKGPKKMTGPRALSYEIDAEMLAENTGEEGLHVVNMAMMRAELTGDLTAEDKTVLRQYGSLNTREINQSFRSPDLEEADWRFEWGMTHRVFYEKIAKAISHVPHFEEPMLMYRGVTNIVDLLGIDPSLLTTEKTRGIRFFDKAFVSVTWDDDYAVWFSFGEGRSNAAILEVEIPAGVQGVNMKDFNGEDELLLQNNLTFEVVEVKRAPTEESAGLVRVRIVGGYYGAPSNVPTKGPLKMSGPPKPIFPSAKEIEASSEVVQSLIEEEYSELMMGGPNPLVRAMLFLNNDLGEINKILVGQVGDPEIVQPDSATRTITSGSVVAPKDVILFSAMSKEDLTRRTGRSFSVLSPGEIFSLRTITQVTSTLEGPRHEAFALTSTGSSHGVIFIVDVPANREFAINLIQSTWGGLGGYLQRDSRFRVTAMETQAVGFGQVVEVIRVTLLEHEGFHPIASPMYEPPPPEAQPNAITPTPDRLIRETKDTWKYLDDVSPRPDCEQWFETVARRNDWDKYPVFTHAIRAYMSGDGMELVRALRQDLPPDGVQLPYMTATEIMYYLDRMMATSYVPTPMISYRAAPIEFFMGSFHPDAWRGMTLEELLSNALVGESFMDRAYASTSLSVDWVESWCHGSSSELRLAELAALHQIRMDYWPALKLESLAELGIYVMTRIQVPRGTSALYLSHPTLQMEKLFPDLLVDYQVPVFDRVQARELLLARNTWYRVLDSYLERDYIYVDLEVQEQKGGDARWLRTPAIDLCGTTTTP